jgi:peptidoglycan/LPS O-acetylase OafA/YrhL
MPYLWFMDQIFWALFFVWLVNGAATGLPGIVGKFFQLKPVAYIGKISYGIYVYHLFMLSLVPIVLAQGSLDFSLLPGWLQFGLLAGVTIGVAAISWHLFESPLNSLKHHFSYAVPIEGRESRRAKAVYF